MSYRTEAQTLFHNWEGSSEIPFFMGNLKWKNFVVGTVDGVLPYQIVLRVKGVEMVFTYKNVPYGYHANEPFQKLD